MKTKGIYEIAISDGFCTWKFPLNPEKGNIYSIDDILTMLCTTLNAPIEEGELVKPQPEKTKP